MVGFDRVLDDLKRVLETPHVFMIHREFISLSTGRPVSERGQHQVMWILPAVLALTPLVFLFGSGLRLAIIYGAMAVVTAGALLPAQRRPVRGSGSGLP